MNVPVQNNVRQTCTERFLAGTVIVMSAPSLFLRAVPAPHDWEDARATPAALVRARMFDAITRAVAEKGYAATTVADITARSRVSRRTFYEHFSDKEDCFLGAYQSASEATLSAVAAATREHPAGDWRGRLTTALVTYIGILAEDPELAQVTLIDVLGAGPRALAVREQILEQYTDFYRRLAVRASRAGSLAPVSDVFLRGIVGAIAEIIQHELLAKRVGELPDLVPTLVALTLTVLGDRESSHRPVAAAQAG
jgi:AcrR family transcriptional regulator